MSDTPKTAALWSRVGAMVVTLDEPVVLRRECAQIERELQAECDALRAALEGIVEFVDAPVESKRPDVFALRINKARAALKEAK